MKYFLFISLIFIALHGISDGAVSHGIYSHPDYPGLCYINSEMILKPGEDVTIPGACSQFSCLEESNAIQTSCGLVSAPPKCKLGDPLHPNAAYPDCCEREVICDSQ